MCSPLAGEWLGGPFGGQYAAETQANLNLQNKTNRILADTKQQTDALQAIREQQQAAQQALQTQSDANFANTTNGFSTGAQAAQQADQAAKATANLSLTPSFIASAQPLNTTMGAPAVVQDAINKRLGVSADKADAYANNLGSLEGSSSSNFLNNLAVTKLANDQATQGTLAQSMGDVAAGADKARKLVNDAAQNKIDIWTQQNKSGGLRQLGATEGAIGKAALFAALMA